MPVSPDLRRCKRDMRRDMLARRAALHAQHSATAAVALCDLFLENISLPSGVVVSAYVATGSEINPAPLIEALQKRGHGVALPVVTGKGVPLIFRRYKTSDALVTGSFMALAEPSDAAPLVEPDIILVPLLAFDRHKFRLGYGGGYYDRTLTLLRSRKRMTAVGIGFAGQEVPAVPVGAHDAPLDKIITENQVIS